MYKARSTIEYFTYIHYTFIDLFLTKLDVSLTAGPSKKKLIYLIK